MDYVEDYIHTIKLTYKQLYIIENALLVLCRLHNEKDTYNNKNYEEYAKPFHYEKEDKKQLNDLHNKIYELYNEASLKGIKLK